MHDEVSETENIRKNLCIERLFTETCDFLLHTDEILIRQGIHFFTYYNIIILQ